MADSSELRIVIFGKAKSNNTIVKDLLEKNLEQGKINGRKVKMIEAPGIFDPDNKPEDLKKSLISCIAECAPGLHAFILVMNIDTFTEEDKALLRMINMCFGEGILKYTALLFTHGEELQGRPIQEFVADNDDLKKCIDDCRDRVHVIDSNYWDDDGRNSTNLKNLLNSIGDIVKNNDRCYHTTQTLDVIIEKVENLIKKKSLGKTEAEARAIVEMIKILAPVVIEVPTLLLLSIMVGIRKGLKKGGVDQVILNTIRGAVEGGVATINIAINSSDLDEFLNNLQDKIKTTVNQCLAQ